MHDLLRSRKTLLLLFLATEGTVKPIVSLMDGFFGHVPNPPTVGFSEVWVQTGLLRAELRFSPEKEETLNA
jgi:uncharacterized protein (DUF362 family)